MPSSISIRRFWLTHFLVASIFLIVAYQLIQLSIIRRPSLLALAEKQHHITIEVPPLRGQILDRHGKEFATSLKVPSVYAVPRLIGRQERAKLAQKLSEVLQLDLSFVEERLSRDKAFIWLKRRVSSEEAENIRQLEHPALGLLEEFKRFYPQGDLLAQVLGFTDVDNRGLEGIELSFNQELQGRPGKRFTKRDALGHEIKAFEMKINPAINGNRIFLTIDQYLQYLTERALDRAYFQWKAVGAAAILMEAKTGRILAVANRPTFDPNAYEKSVAEARRNRAVTDMYEPGSVFKIVTASTALNEKKVTFESTFHCENGAYRYYGSRVLHDVHSYGRLTFPEIIIKSSNIGTVKIANLMPPKTFHRYIRNFGFGAPAGIDLPGEASGYVRPPLQWSKTSPFNIPIGQEIQVTLLQMVTAMAVIANGGDLVQPYIVTRVQDQAGVVLREKKPAVRRKVIESEAARQMREILIRAVEEGTGKNAKINSIPVGGKTGTAQKVRPGGRGYSHSNFMASFIGFGSGDDPELVMGIVIDDPRPLYYGGAVAAPVFKEVMELALLSMGYVPKNAELFETPTEPQDLPENRPMSLPAQAAGKAF
jgi:cell division protein FtsI (penicillin-binding protein 3)